MATTSLTRAPSPWRQVVVEKRKIRDDAISPYAANLSCPKDDAPLYAIFRKSLVDDANTAITVQDDIETLHQDIVKGKYTAEAVTLAYIKRACLAHQLTNSLTEVCFDEALEQARELDVVFTGSARPIGPLHGIPFTLKDQFNIKGYDSTIGYVGRAFKPAKSDAALVSIIKRLGGIVIAKTNLPQSIMWCETENPLWGLTVNPRNSNFTPGGSSGGESVLQALHASLVGFGTDIGGSVRIPQALNGLYGLKPSSSRLPYEGVPVSTEGQEHVPSSVGPMTRSLKSLIYITKTIIDVSPWSLDPRCSPLPWREEAYHEIQSCPMVIGVMSDDGVVKVHPPIERALKQVCDRLRQAGHELIDWDPSGHDECVEIMDQYYAADGCEDIRRDVEAGGEPYIPHVEALVNRGKAISVYEYWQLNKRKLAAQKRYLDKWNAARSLTNSNRAVDVLLTPCMPHTAVPHRGCKWVGYTKVWNFLDYTALTFPVSTVSKELDAASMEGYEPRNELDRWNQKLYDREAMAGHPINLQLVGRKLCEEVVLGAAKAVERALMS